ncbi:FUSC family protein [Chitinophagaceae bacterium LB-8]|uniref:FUSC family protein n=1 Tax=Paraflavisolibacter caeni TaxID=2982496 RepID=A0A9X2XNZ4_9BACT|nr:FUSC family membrane protein [Paraflavisolibacter caeni]MCU7550033.1 FUSC family protein [Paraflavisolibacter caeni]
MKKQSKEVRLFFFSQQFEDGIRITLAVLLPALIGSFLNEFGLGLTFSLGALCTSLVDAPGPIIHRKNSMFFCLMAVFLVTIATGFARQSNFIMGIEVFLFSFFFSMFNVYGQRAALVGSAALLSMALTMDKPVDPWQVVPQSFIIFCGGIWYMTISLLSYRVRPYRAAQRALGECIRELGIFLSIKAKFYDADTDLDENYRQLVAQQIVVNEKQDAVRELMFKTRQIVKDTTPEGRRLVLAFTDTVDLFEDMTAAYYDYSMLRARYGQSSILKDIHALAMELANELDNIGAAIFSNDSYRIKLKADETLLQLKKKIDEQAANELDKSNLILKKMLVNIRKMMQRINDIAIYFESSEKKFNKETKTDYAQFVGHQSLDAKIFLNNLNFESAVFKHSFRVGVACIIGFVIAKSFAYSQHSYWILMTIAFMLKPAFSLTKQRNYERIIGTLIGGVIGATILHFIDNKDILFALMVLLMIATYSFQRVKYFVSVICMTPFILILFAFLGVGFVELIKERVFDTVIGCVIAFLSGYLLFPIWESAQLHTYLKNMLQANYKYLYKVAEGLAGKVVNVTDYKLARKEVYVNSANLSAAFQRMLSEPKSTQKNKTEIHQFVVLNHILFSNIATLASTVLHQKGKVYPEDVIRSVRKVLGILCDTLNKLEHNFTSGAEQILIEYKHEGQLVQSADDVLLKEQLDFVYRLSKDIGKVTEAIVN